MKKISRPSVVLAVASLLFFFAPFGLVRAADCLFACQTACGGGQTQVAGDCVAGLGGAPEVCCETTNAGATGGGNSFSGQSQTPGGINVSALQPYKEGIINIINQILVPVLFAVAFIVFLYGVYKYFILGADSDTERETGRQFVLWGIIGFVVILSVWGIVNLVMSTLGLSPNTTAPPAPTFNPATGAN